MNVSFEVPRQLLNKVEILLERIPYLSEIITAMSYNNEARIVNLTVSEQDLNSTQMSELRTSYLELCDSLENTRVLKERVVKSNLDMGHDIQLKPKDDSSIQQLYMDEFDILLLEKLDKEFIRIATNHGAELREYPSVLNRKNMTRNQYHIHFPQNIFGVTSVPHDYNAINNFRLQAQQDTYDGSLLFQGEVLQPCICYHCYEELQEKKWSNARVLTGKGKCFRHEIEWRKDNFRRNEFTMREIVYFGNEDWVVHKRNHIMEDVWGLFESLGMKGRIATATDPFFFSQDLNTKGTYQMMSNAKYELIATTLSGKDISIASFNYCQDMLCSKYEIKNNEDTTLHSGCVAFGIDRWKEAFIDLYGRELNQWPETKIEKEMLI
ncbi:hypothetical protein [Paenibacillus sp. OK003]|uniref:hypothetical protein n=1 Tax=Paenibacillus sp. OK003 TaxID=1884380 RepID=UPI0008B88BF3|nr:hypothetical protein [Paenibacillus sp. OK003]SEL55475.1 tRNA synthetase class II core domain (G, H, P, S and T) [Paenibacillus sp. OK003]